MKKAGIRNFSFVVLFACMLCAGSVAGRDSLPAGKEGVVFSPERLSVLKSVRIHYQFDTVYLDRIGETSAWNVRGTGLAADDSMMTGLYNFLGTLHERRVVARGNRDSILEAYGLDQVEAWGVRLGFGSGKKTETILVSLNPEDRALFWKRAERPEIHRVRNVPWRLAMTKDGWASRSLFPVFSLFDVRTIEVAWKEQGGQAGHYKLLKVRSDSAVVVEPDTLQMHLRKASELFVLTEQFAVDGLFSSDETPFRGDTSSWVDVRLTLENGTVHAVKAFPNDARTYRVRHPQGGAWVKVERFRFDKFKRSVTQLTEFPLHGPETLEWSVHEDLRGIGVFAPHKESQDELHHTNEGAEEHDD